ncbi:MAG: hypothetical protein JXJ22_03950 [Bacteroidales bacterium]|nr:hypothetical protein [Bacteroidales bacterium]
MNAEILNSKNAGLIIKILGTLQVFIGVVSLFFAPLEIYCYYLFSEGGRFFYEGFAIGSFLYGLLFAQIVGYYFIAVLFILIGYGHLNLKSWTLKLSKACTWFWMIFGIPVILFFLPLFFMKDYEVQHPVFLFLVFVLIVIIGIPLFLLYFYNQKSVQKLFSNTTLSDRGIQKMPVQGILLLLVYCLYVLGFHVIIFYHGIFPFFGSMLTGLPGIFMNDLCILCVLLFMYGLYKRIYWTWIGSLAFYMLLTISTILTFLNTPYTRLIELLNFPETERHIFINLPLRSYQILPGTGLILLITMLLIIKSGKYYKISRNTLYTPV